LGYEVGGDEEGGVGALGVVRGGKVVEDVVGVLLVGEELLNLADVLPDLGQVQRPEVLEEPLVRQVLNIPPPTLSTLKKKALGTSFGGFTSARYRNFSEWCKRYSG
jgi:hypothetical protein